MLSVSVVALTIGIPAAAVSATAAPVSDAVFNSAALSMMARAPMSGNDLLRQSQRSLSLVSVSLKRMTRADRAKAAPMLKALKEADRALKAVKTATGNRDSRALARALSAASRAVGKLNSTYKRARLKDRNVKEGMRAFNASWQQTQKRLQGAKGRGNKELARANARRINAVKTRLVAQRDRRRDYRDEYDELVYLIAMLDRALYLNRYDDYQWQALAVLDDCYGYYDGYYDYMVVYQPDYIQYYRDDYYYWNGVNSQVVNSYDYYYSDYSYNTYEETTVIDNSVNIEINVTNITNNEIIVEADNQVDQVETVAAETETETDGAQQLAEADAAQAAALQAEPPPPVEDPAVVEDPVADQLVEEPPPPVEEVEKIAAEVPSAEAVDLNADTGTEESTDPATAVGSEPDPNAPTEEPATEEPAAEPTGEPAAEPTEEPAAEPTEEPAAEPTEEPAAEPTEEPAAEPTEEPAAEPTEEPAAEPTEEPVTEPEAAPEPEPEPEAAPEPEPEPEAAPEPEPQPEAAPEPEPEPEAAPEPEPQPEAAPEETPAPAEDLDGDGNPG